MHLAGVAACYDHGTERESWIDVTFGTWGNGPDYTDHVTFGCRIAGFWQMGDFIVETDPMVHQHHYGHTPS